MPAPKGNKNAAKAEENKASVWLQCRGTPADKSKFKSLAESEGKSLCQWIKDKITGELR